MILIGDSKQRYMISVQASESSEERCIEGSRARLMRFSYIIWLGERTHPGFDCCQQPLHSE